MSEKTERPQSAKSVRVGPMRHSLNRAFKDNAMRRLGSANSPGPLKNDAFEDLVFQQGPTGDSLLTGCRVAAQLHGMFLTEDFNASR
jgi:hypothetical protein